MEYIWLGKNIEKMRKVLNELNDQAEFLYQSPKLSHEPKSTEPKDDKILSIVVKIDEAKEKIGELIRNRCTTLIKIETYLSKLEEKERFLMHSRYISGTSWEQIAVDMGYSIQHVWRMHGDILKKMRDNES